MGDTTQIAIENFEGIEMMSLMLKVMLILFFGIAVWRLMTIFARKGSQPKESGYFKRKYSDKWKRR